MLTNYRVHLHNLAFVNSEVADTGGGGGDSGTGADPATGGGDTAGPNAQAAAAASAAQESTQQAGVDGATTTEGGDKGGESGETGDKPAGEAAVPSHIEAASAAKVKAEITALAIDLGLEGEFATREELLAGIAAVEHQARETEEEADVEARFATRSRNIATEVDKILDGFVFDATDEEGEDIEVKLTPAQRKQVSDAALKEVKALRTDIRVDAHRAVLGDVGDAGVSLLHPEAVESFKTATDGDDGAGVTIKEWLDEFREHAAPTSKYVKKLEAEHEAALAARYAEGVDDGVAGKATGQVSAEGGKSVATPAALTVEEASTLPIQELMRRRQQAAS